MTLQQLQIEQKAWADYNFPGRDRYFPLLGAMEELGELAHAHLKELQGIRGTSEDHFKAKVDAIGDVVIYLADYCNLNGIDFEWAVQETWRVVSRRDWTKNRESGESEVTQGSGVVGGPRERSLFDDLPNVDNLETY